MKKPAVPPIEVNRVSDLTRLIVESPEEATLELLADLAFWQEAMARPGFEAQFAAAAGVPPGDFGWVAQGMVKRINELIDGRDEAAAIQRFLADHEIGSLRAHLKVKPVSPECVVWLLAENKRLTRSLVASDAAKRKNASPRAFVAEAWASRTDFGQSKASFARAVAHEVRRRFDVIVTADRIARYWLPKD
jgi:hypothetical protein